MVARHPAVAEGASDIDFPSTERWSETTMKHVDHKVNPVTGVEYDKYTDGEAVEVIGTTPNGENFHHYFSTRRLAARNRQQGKRMGGPVKTRAVIRGTAASLNGFSSEVREPVRE